jgi:hypothetical protein
LSSFYLYETHIPFFIVDSICGAFFDFLEHDTNVELRAGVQEEKITSKCLVDKKFFLKNVVTKQYTFKCRINWASTVEPGDISHDRVFYFNEQL